MFFKKKKHTQEIGETSSDDGNIAVVLETELHCEGCAKKVRRVAKNLSGVSKVSTDCHTNRVTVTGKVDPFEVKVKLEVRLRMEVVLISPLPAAKKKPEENPVEPREPSLSTVTNSMPTYDGPGPVSYTMQAHQYPTFVPAQYPNPYTMETHQHPTFVSAMNWPSYDGPEPVSGHQYPAFVNQNYPFQGYPNPNHGYHAPMDQSNSADHMFSDENPNACSIM